MSSPIPDLLELSRLTDAELRHLKQTEPARWADLKASLAATVTRDMRETALSYYQTLNLKAEAVHRSTARELAIVGGNRSGKSESMLVELAIALTGHIPISMASWYPREKLRPPIRARVVVNSHSRTLWPVIIPKLRWDTWEGPGEPGEGAGHWGWIPRRCLPNGSWEKAYNAKTDMLKCAVDTVWQGPNGPEWLSGISTCQFLSYDMDVSAFSGSSLHFIGHDELPPERIYRENRMRTLDVKGRIITAFTPPDEAGQSREDVSYFYDQVYEPGLAHAPGIDTVVLWTEQNRGLDHGEIEAIKRSYTADQLEARLYGRFLHLSGVVYPLFSAYPAHWCFACHRKTATASCLTCHGDHTAPFCHVVEPFEVPKTWPVIFVIDPHPRKPDAIGWFALAPTDEVVMIGELEVEGDAADVAREILAWESAHRVSPMRRLMDPNIATQKNDRLERGVTLRDAYDRVGIRCDLANDAMELGIQNVADLLKPDPALMRPRFTTFGTNRKFIYGMTHWAWDEWKSPDHDRKELVRDRHKDFPDLLRYLASDLPTFNGLKRAQRWKWGRHT